MSKKYRAIECYHYNGDWNVNNLLYIVTVSGKKIEKICIKTSEGTVDTIPCSLSKLKAYTKANPYSCEQYCYVKYLPELKIIKHDDIMSIHHSMSCFFVLETHPLFSIIQLQPDKRNYLTPKQQQYIRNLYEKHFSYHNGEPLHDPMYCGN